MIRKPWGTKAAALAIATVVACSPAGQAGAAAATVQASDLNGHWAQETLTRWLEAGKISGFGDGTVRPNRAATRAELVSLANQALSLKGSADIEFADVSEKQWFYQSLRVAVGNGYIAGYSDHTFRPNDEITREELAVILSRLLHLSPAEPNSAADADELGAWSRGGVGAVMKAGYMSVDRNGKFRPKDKATRAEVVVVLDRVSGAAGQQVTETKTYNTAGIYGPEDGTDSVAGNVSLEADGITLRNVRISGDLALTAAIGDGDIQLRNVAVDGATTVAGGGPNSVHLSDSSLGSVTVRKEGGQVRLVAEGNTAVGPVTLASGGILTEDEGLTGEGFGDVEIASGAGPSPIVKLSGHYDSVEVAAPGVTLEFSDASAKTVTIVPGGEGAKVKLPAGSSIEALQADGKLEVTGAGEIKQAVLNADGSSLEKQPGKLELGSGIAASVAGQSVTGEGTASGGSSGGGAGGGSGSGGSSGGAGGGSDSGGESGSGGDGGTGDSGNGSDDGDDQEASDVLGADALFASAQSATVGSLVTLNAAPSAGTVVWFAPAGTEAFAESSTMTKLTGNGTEKRIVAPSQAGSYKLFVLRTGGEAVGEASGAILTVTGQLSGEVAGDLFTANRTVQGGSRVTLTKAAGSGYHAWFAPSGTTAFAPGSTMTSASAGDAYLAAPTSEGEYRLYLVGDDGAVSDASAATLIVDNTPPSNTLLAANVSMKGQVEFSLGALPAGVVSAWLAPAGTTAFAAGSTMTQTSGSGARTPAAEGSYKLYLVDEAGNVSAPSAGTLKVDNTAPIEQNAAFATDRTVRSGESIQLNGLPDGVTAWFAPAVATAFAEGPTMTRSRNGVIQAPMAAAPYKLFLIDEAGNVSKPSVATLHVEG